MSSQLCGCDPEAGWTCELHSQDFSILVTHAIQAVQELALFVIDQVERRDKTCVIPTLDFGKGPERHE